MAENPYANLPPESFWKSGVAAERVAAPAGLYRRKWTILPTDAIATAGSCFAQHIGRHLRRGGFTLMDVEPAPRPFPPARQEAFGYGLYSARYGNIYTARQLVQVAREAFEGFKPSEVVWEKGGAFYDCFRPGVEPFGLSSPEEVRAHRDYHLECVRELFLTMDMFIFTLGLTECWMDRESGDVYPTVPGSVAGSYDPDRHTFKNFTFSEVYDDIKRFRKIVTEARGRSFRMLLTVSPVPLTATASNRHVLQATTYSKAVLRAVAGQLEFEDAEIDYYPSYEIITHPWGRRDFFEANARTISPRGVGWAMKTFMDEHGVKPDAQEQAVVPVPPIAASPPPAPKAEADLVCEEYLLEQFAGGAR